MDHKRKEDDAAAKFSTPLTSLIMHDRRATHDAIAVGARTAVLDRPRLDTRLVAGRSPLRIVFDRHGIADADNCLHVTEDRPLGEVLEKLYREHNITSLLVEGGASLLRQFISPDHSGEQNLWDEAYIEISPVSLGVYGSVKAPSLPSELLTEVMKIDGNSIYRFNNRR